MLGRLSEADELVARVHTIMDEIGEWIWLFSFWNSFIFSWQDDPEAAEHVIRPAYEALGRIGEKSHFSSMCHALSNAVYLQGRYEEAEQLTVECEEACRANDVHSQILWRSIRAKVLARRGERAAAERLARDAVAVAEEGDFDPAHADALMDLAEVLELAGNPTAAATQIEKAIRVYERKGNVLMTARAHARLEELT
jgi:ATP/maltotriose-dependent transcriptional regulator MalT